MSPPHPPRNPESVGILGGEGRMGACFAQIFSEAGLQVAVQGPCEPQRLQEFVREVDVVLVSVPIEATVPLIEALRDLLKPAQLLTDLTSLKAAPLKAMATTSAAAIGGHPLFGPQHAPRGQRMVLSPLRTAHLQAAHPLEAHYLAWYRRLLERAGLTVVVCEAEMHDRTMAQVQGLPHWSLLVLAEALERSGANLELLDQLSTPTYRSMLALLRRILAADAGLYAQIQRQNPHLAALRGDWRRASQELEETLHAEPVTDARPAPDAAFEREFRRLAERFAASAQDERSAQAGE